MPPVPAGASPAPPAGAAPPPRVAPVSVVVAAPVGPAIDRDILRPQLLVLVLALVFALLPRALLRTFARTPHAASDHGGGSGGSGGAAVALGEEAEACPPALALNSVGRVCPQPSGDLYIKGAPSVTWQPHPTIVPTLAPSVKAAQSPGSQPSPLPPIERVPVPRKVGLSQESASLFCPNAFIPPRPKTAGSPHIASPEALAAGAAAPQAGVCKARRVGSGAYLSPE